MNKDTFSLLLSEGEGFHLEYKEGISKDISSEMVAFVNSRGGKILLGITDAGKIKGVSDKNRVKSQIQDIARNCEPSISVVLSEYKDVIIITIPEGKDKPYRCKTGFYTRTGPSSQKLNRNEIISLIHNEGHIHWEVLPYTDFPKEHAP
ncbi:MAG: AlbA family DNA-binding domain-containing protein [Salinispira sp.]